MKGINKFNQHLGIKVESFNDTQCTVSMDILPEHCNSIENIVHGGVTFTLADAAMGHVAAPPGKDGIQQCVTTELKINYLSPAYGPKLFATAKVIKNGKTLAIVQGEVTSSEGKLLAVALGTYAKTKGARI